MAGEEDALFQLLGRPSHTGSVSAGGASFTGPDFSWIGRLPAIYGEAQQQRQRQQTLASLPEATDLNDPNTHYRIAQQLFRNGDVVGGMKFQASGNKLEELRIRGLEGAAYSEYMKKYGSNPLPSITGRQTGQTDTTGAPREPAPVPEYVPSAATPTPTYQWPDTAVPGRRPPGQSALPSEQGTAEALPPSLGRAGQPLAPPTAEPSPSEQVIAAAQQGPLGGTSGPTPQQPLVAGQLAQAGGAFPPVGGNPPPQLRTPVPGTTGMLPAEAQGGYPQWMQGAGATPVPAQQSTPQSTPLAPQQPAVGRRVQVPIPDTANLDALKEVNTLGEQIMRASGGGRFASGELNMLNAMLRNALARALPDDKEQREYRYDQIQRDALGLPRDDITDWRTRKVIAADLVKEASAIANEYGKDAKKNRETIQTLESMKSIVDNPQFASGGGLGTIDSWTRRISGLRDYLVAQGVPSASLPSIEGPQTTASLRQVFQGMHNASIYSMLGSLGNGVSNRDVGVIGGIFPGPDLTEEANRLAIQFLLKTNEQRLATAQRAFKYMSDREMKATPYELNQVINNFAQKNSILEDQNGNLTDLGKKLQGLAPVDIKGKGGFSMVPSSGQLLENLVPGPLRGAAGVPSSAPAGAKITPDLNGKVGTDAAGNRWIIRDGQAFPLPRGQ